MNAPTLTRFVDPGTLAGLWSALSLTGAAVTVLLVGAMQC